MEALVQPNVTVFTDGGLTKITPTGFLDPRGNQHDVDVIICAVSHLLDLCIIKSNKDRLDSTRRGSLSFL